MTDRKAEGAARTEEVRAVLVGVDGSERNEAAVEYAAREARSTGRPLSLLAVIDEPPIPMSIRPGYPDGEAEWHVLNKLAERFMGEHLDVSRDVRFGNPVTTLLTYGEDADLLVVGKRGLGAFARMLVGSTSIGVSGRAAIPVVVVPDIWEPPEPDPRPVLAGISLDEKDDTVVDFAATEARRRDVPLRVVHAVDRSPVLVWDTAENTAVLREAMAHDSVALEEVAARVRDRFPDLAVVSEQHQGNPTHVLLTAGREAQLLVVGRSHQGRSGFPLGSAVRGLLHYSELPVAVVPPAG